MKKVEFKIIKYIFFMLLAISFTGTYAQSGCYGSSGTVYFDDLGHDRFAYNGAKMHNVDDYYCVRTTGTCRIGYTFFGSFITLASGERVTLNPLPCPIDDYVYILVAATAGFVYFMVSKNKLAFIRNQ